MCWHNWWCPSINPAMTVSDHLCGAVNGMWPSKQGLLSTGPTTSTGHKPKAWELIGMWFQSHLSLSSTKSSQWCTVCRVLVHCCFNRSWKSSIGITIAIMKKKNRQNNSVTNTNTYWLFCPFFVGWLPTYMFPFQPQLHLQINHWWMTR